MLRRWLNWIRGLFPRAVPMVAVMKVTNGTRTLTLFVPQWEYTVAADPLFASYEADLVRLAGDGGWMVIPPAWEVVVTYPRPRFDPPTAGELGL